MLLFLRFETKNKYDMVIEKILSNSYDLTWDEKCVGIEAKVKGNFIILKNVSEIHHSGPDFIRTYFFGFLLKVANRYYLIGAIMPIIMTLIIPIIGYLFIREMNNVIELLLVGALFYILCIKDIRHIKSFIEQCCRTE